MLKPVLIKKMPNGATIHSYQITGGHTTFDRYLACYNGVCQFYPELKVAETSLQKMT